MGGPTLQLSTNLQETKSDQLRDSAQLSIHSSSKNWGSKKGKKGKKGKKNVSEYKQREFNSTANVSGYPPLNSNVSNSTRIVASSIPVPLDQTLMDQSASEQLQGESQLAAKDAVQAVEKATGAAVAADAAEFGGRKYPRKD